MLDNVNTIEHNFYMFFTVGTAPDVDFSHGKCQQNVNTAYFQMWQTYKQISHIH